MKKGLPIVIVLVLLLCIFVVVGGGAVYYFVLRNTPEKAFDKAIASINEDSYEYTSEAEISMDISVPDYPEFSMSMTMTADGEGKVDSANDKEYTKSTVTTEGVTETTEVYYIGEDVYSRTGDDDFKKMSKDEVEDISGETYDVYKNLSSDVDYTVLDDEEVDGVDCYHYSVPLDETLLEDFLASFTETIGNDPSVTMGDVTINDAKIEMWVSKSSSKAVKSVMMIGELSVSATTSGVEMKMSMNDLEVATMFMNWGEKVDIEAPI
ncbi:hypothetical protein JW766_03440 [Candidatus Dojkabacteria bacterium]|nr:hypothetical protein [Candidatus Dojkabacteria bacterium]